MKKVDDAITIVFLSQSGVVVLLFGTLLYISGVNGHAPPPPVLKSVPQANFPRDHVSFPVVESQAVSPSTNKRDVVA